MNKIELSVIENAIFKVKTINIGATIYEILYKPKNNNLVLNLGSIKKYKKKNPYVGCICGRFANRISKAKFRINNKEYNLNNNEGKNTLHGGNKGFNKYIWKKIKHSRNKIIYEINSKHMDQGFPGNLNIKCQYELIKGNFFIKYFFESDKQTHVNLTNHSYWNLNLNKKKNIYNHELKINSDYYLPTNKKKIPLGNFKKVAGTIYDFKKFNNLGKKILKKKEGYDLNYIVKKRKDNFVASLKNNFSKLKLNFYSDQPGLQLYTGQFLKFQNKLFPFQGVCLENQHFPNTPNEKKFPSTLIFPGKKYKFFSKINVTEI